MELNELVFIDCYALSNEPPKIGDWELCVEAYEALNPKDPSSGVKPGGPRRVRIVFAGIRSVSNLNVSESFKLDFSIGNEACEIYKLYSEGRDGGNVSVHIESDYINGNFLCQSVNVQLQR
jgi:hypothetical protein